MIRVSVHLISANDGSVKELARMDICNDGTATSHTRSDYIGTAYRGRGEQLEKRTPLRMGFVLNWPREAYHVWNLIAAILKDMGYTQGAANVEPPG